MFYKDNWDNDFSLQFTSMYNEITSLGIGDDTPENVYVKNASGILTDVQWLELKYSDIRICFMNGQIL